MQDNDRRSYSKIHKPVRLPHEHPGCIYMRSMAGFAQETECKVRCADSQPFNRLVVVAAITFLMKRTFFRALVWLNKKCLPKYSGKDPATLKKWQLALVWFRYWALKNAL